MKVVYVAGPFVGETPWDIECNIRRAEEVGLKVARVGAMPLIPHANTRFFHGQQSAEFWYDGTLELLKRSDAIVMVDGWKSSKGSLMEHAYAHLHGMPIFTTSLFSEMAEWVRANKR